jgi:hypothetical protein
MKRKRNPKPIVLKIYIEHKVKSHKKLHGMVFLMVWQWALSQKTHCIYGA